MATPRYLSAFSSRNYRLFFGGQVVSLIGTWMTQTASLWLIYHLSSSAFLLGLVGFASQIPIFFLAPFAGVWIDRLNRHRLLIITQVLAMLQSLALAGFALTNTITATILVALSLVQGLINALDMPARQASVVDFIEKKEHLGNAIALNSSMFNLARLIGPAIGGFVIARYGAGICFLADGLSYLAVIAGLLMMKVPERSHRPSPQHPLVELRDGFHYAYHHVAIKALIYVVSLVSFIGFSYAVLTPIFARDVFGGDARTLGYLMGASGVGALLGAIYLGTRKSVRGLGNVMTFGGSCMAAGLIGFSFSRSLWLSLICLTCVGAGGVLVMASGNTLVQTFVDDAMRGRVMSIFTMSFTGTTPLGNLAMGALAGVIGAPRTLAISGLVCALVVFFFGRKLPRLRRLAEPLFAELEAPVKVKGGGPAQG